MLSNTKTKTILHVAIGLAILVALVVGLAIAGPLNPPAGPVMPTGPSLAQISEGVQSLSIAQNNCRCPRLGYRIKQVSNVSAANGTTLVSGSGVIKRLFYVSPNQVTVQLRDANGLVIEVKGNYTSGTWLDLDLQFQGFLSLTAGGTTSSIEFIYALESDF